MTAKTKPITLRDLLFLYPYAGGCPVVLFSIKGKWCKLIRDGKKRIEWRIKPPKPPFIGLIYQCKDGSDPESEQYDGTIIGTFYCSRIDTFAPSPCIHKSIPEEYYTKSCVSFDDLESYCYGVNVCAIMMEEFHPFSPPSRLDFCYHLSKDGGFALTKAPQSWMYVTLNYD